MDLLWICKSTANRTSRVPAYLESEMLLQRLHLYEEGNEGEQNQMRNVAREVLKVATAL
jgi:hypothetical protein